MNERDQEILQGLKRVGQWIIDRAAEGCDPDFFLIAATQSLENIRKPKATFTLYEAVSEAYLRLENYAASPEF
jgi:hypothetical protein